jgi:SOS-response transcriptional repressor LexA
LTGEERAHIIRLLHDSANEFLDFVTPLPDAQWTCPAGSECWSVQQIAEHIVLGEQIMLTKIAEALANPASEDWEEQDARKTRFLNRVLPDRSHKAIAPAPLEPRHGWTRHEAITRYKEGRARTLRFVEELDQPLKNHTAEHPFPVFGKLNAYQWLLYIPLHNSRHNQQIAEAIKAPQE